MAEVPTVAITVNIPITDITAEKIHEEAVRVAVERILGITVYHDNDGDEQEDLTLLIQLRAQATKLAHDKIIAATDATIPRVIEEVLKSPFIPTNPYGECKGGPMTLREQIAGQVKVYLGEKIDNYGTPRYDGSPRLNTLVRKHIEEAFADGLKAEVAAATAAFRAGLKEKLATSIAEAVANLLLSAGKDAR